MDTVTSSYTRSEYGTRYSSDATTIIGIADQSQENGDHYDLFLLIQDMLHRGEDLILEFPSDDWCHKGGTDTALGAGGFSSVVRKIGNRRWGDRSAMAYKQFRSSFDYDGRADDQATLGRIVNEVRALSAVSIRSHTNINRLRGILFETQSHRRDGRLFPSLILDPSPLGNLLEFIRDPVRMVDGPYWECCLDVARGLEALHKGWFIHGDVKCENVLIFPASDLRGRDFRAKLTDFGCSMTLDVVGPSLYTKLAGSSPPYDAPEAEEMIRRDHLPFTDIYSYGILVWRVATDGAEPFNRPRYRVSREGDGATSYNHTLIRREKKDEGVRTIALNEILDPDLDLVPVTADALCEVVSIALASDPQQRNLNRILECFNRDEGRFLRRTFGLSIASGQLLRDFAKAEIETMRILSQARFGLPLWRSVPPKAHHSIHTIHRYGTLDVDFKGFGLSRLPPPSKALRAVLLAIERMYLSSRLLIPPVVLIRSMISIKAAGSIDEITQLTAGVIKASVVQGIQVTARYLDKPSLDAASEGISRAVNEFQEACRMLGGLIESAAGGRPNEAAEARQQPSGLDYEGISVYDRPGGLAATDTIVMTNERSAANLAPRFSPGNPSSSLDFHLLSTFQLPFALQAQLFEDISSHVKAASDGPQHEQLAMVEAICYGQGFGIKQDYIRYLSLVKSSCERGYRPAQVCLQKLHDALGLPLPAEILSSPQFERVRNGFPRLTALEEAPPRRIPAIHPNGSIRSVVSGASVPEIEKLLNIYPKQINERDNDGDSLLIAACRLGNLAMANFLIDRGADCRATNNLGETCLHWVWSFDLPFIPTVVDLLIRGGADPNAVADEGPSPDFHSPYPVVRGTALHRAVAQGNAVAVQELLRHEASASRTLGPVFLHKGRCLTLDSVQLACTWHEPEILEMLLYSVPFYPINADTSGGVGLLYFAIQCQGMHHRMARGGSDLYFNLLRTIDVLLSRGCTNVVDTDGLTALHLAVQSDSLEMLEHVLTVDSLAKDINTVVGGTSALHQAISMGRAPAFELLVSRGANVLLNPNQGPILDFSIRVIHGNDYFVKRILELGVHSITPADKNHALAVALKERQWELAEFLLENGANINGLTHPNRLLNWSETVFGDIIHGGDPDKSMELIESTLALANKYNQKPEFIVIPVTGDSALHVAASTLWVHEKHETARIYSILLQLFPGRSHLEARNSKGWTALHAAIGSRNTVGVRALVDAGANVNSMALIEGSPVGPSVKDMLFAQLFIREDYDNFDIRTRDNGDCALEQIFKIFSHKPVVGFAKRSITLRAEQRQHMSAHDRRVADFVDVLSLLPQPLVDENAPDIINSTVSAIVKARSTGKMGEFMRQPLKLDARDVGRTIQWTGIEKVRYLWHQGARQLKTVGLWDAYIDS